MIGVVATAADMDVAREFFELFKTPWEPAVVGRVYKVVLCTTECRDDIRAELFLMYRSTFDLRDREAGVGLHELSGPSTIEWNGSILPVYGRLAGFTGCSAGAEMISGGVAVDYRRGSVRRIGYDLFREIDHLLTRGQPTQYASTPTLELHIEILRHLLVTSGISFVEIPPRPAGYDFTCCLTHDVDFFGIRRHQFDRTLLGFVARASWGSLTDLIRGRRTLGEAVHNWAALLSLPFVFMRLVPDLWRPFRDYGHTEDRRRSTFFMVPFKKRPGVPLNGHVEPTRAVAYQMSEVREEIRNVAHCGSEIAVHGIDAWCDGTAGDAEKRELTAITGQKTAGVRMHWLYFADHSPRCLETAGFAYDSTRGYNDAAGYWAGTSQVFRLPGTQALMELPLAIMDSALFYPDRMSLTPRQASTVCRELVANATRIGGTLVVNWHCRSLAPERLWGRFYRELLTEIERHRVWFATAREAVDWFRWRRSIRFAEVNDGYTVTPGSPDSSLNPLPPANIRIFRAGDAQTPFEEHRLEGQVMKLSLPR
jgi:hypothetical protein